MRFPPLTYGVTAISVATVIAAIIYLLLPLLGQWLPDGDQRLVTTVWLTAAVAGYLTAVEWLPRRTTAAVAAPYIPPAIEEPARTLFIGNLAFRVQPSELEQLFGQYGRVESVRIMKDRITRRPRGFAFIVMEGGAALRALEALNGQPFHGRQMRISEGVKRERNEEVSDEVS
jgi:hypothetical protein